MVAFAAKPAILTACAVLALGACALVLLRAARGGGLEDLLPRIDVAAYNDAL